MRQMWKIILICYFWHPSNIFWAFYAANLFSHIEDILSAVSNFEFYRLSVLIKLTEIFRIFAERKWIIWEMNFSSIFKNYRKSFGSFLQRIVFFASMRFSFAKLLCYMTYFERNISTKFVTKIFDNFSIWLNFVSHRQLWKRALIRWEIPDGENPAIMECRFAWFVASAKYIFLRGENIYPFRNSREY